MMTPDTLLEEKKNDADVASAETILYSVRPLPPGAPPTATPSPTEPVALIICHGMGQQVRHETLAEAADNLHHGRRSGIKQAIPVRYMRFTDANHPEKHGRLLARAEIEVDVPDQEFTGRPLLPGFRQAVHVYEVYWAPLTEGQIGLTEVVRFLVSSGMKGLRYFFTGFKRWLFGAEVSFQVNRRAFFGLLGLLVLIFSLVVINSLLTVVVSENLLQTASMHRASPELVNRLTWHLTQLLVLAVVLTGGIQFCNSYQRRPAGQPWAVGWVWALLGGGSALLLYAAFCMARDYFTLRNPASDLSGSAQLLSGRNVWVALVWGASLLVSGWCRNFFIQYLGDVAIYVDAYSLDKFFAIKARIRQLTQHTFDAVYGARVGENFLYQRIVITGHSLGSLVAYDALNALLVADEAVAGGLRVSARTRAFVTFGSPLDKTAFLFHPQSRKTAVYTALDASRQPLLWDKAVRQDVQWINLYATSDVVSGLLSYYDAPTCPQPVLNFFDPDAFTPVYAHVQYWNGPVLSRSLRFALGGRVPTREQLT